MNIFKKIFKEKTPMSESDPAEYLKRVDEAQRKYGGYLNTPHKVKQLKSEGENKKAIELLLSAVDLVESEANYIGGGWGVAPWYYEQLAIIYRKEKDYHNEVKILERYSQQKKAPGKGPEKLADRLVKAKLLLEKNA